VGFRASPAQAARYRTASAEADESLCKDIEVCIGRGRMVSGRSVV
jgi:hypothetical protein